MKLCTIDQVSLMTHYMKNGSNQVMAFAGLTQDSMQTDMCYSRAHITAEMKPNINLKQNECPYVYWTVHHLDS